MTLISWFFILFSSFVLFGFIYENEHIFCICIHVNPSLGGIRVVTTFDCLS
jgi:hypothetical protein